MKFRRLISTALLTVMLVVFANVPVSSAEENLNINYQVVALKNIEDENSLKKNAYVNMYKIKIVDNEYVGTRVKTLSTGKDGYKAVFTIKPGEMVGFVAFKKKGTALKKQNKTFTFTTPPLKNFSVSGGPVELCYTAGVDTENKLEKNDGSGDFLCTTAENNYLQTYLELTK